MLKRTLTLALLAVLSGGTLLAQVTGEPSGTSKKVPAQPSTSNDSLFIFQPARPLIDSSGLSSDYNSAWGFDVLFSNSGFGAGLFYQWSLSKRLSTMINLGITGARHSDEFPVWTPSPDPEGFGDYVVPGKVNRLYALPLMVGLRYRVLDNLLVDNVRPYVNAGIGPTMVVALPYQYEFFSSFGHARGYFTGGGFVGVGAEFGSGRPMLGVNVRYFYIPIHPGIESIQDQPITDFGGLFLTLNVGFPSKSTSPLQ
jgi:hypothetical protein